MPIQLLIVDPHVITRFGIRQTLASRHNIDIIGEADSMSDAVEMARQSPPHVLIVDLDPNDDEAANNLKAFHNQFPEAKTLVFTAYDGPEIAESVLAVGASGYLIKAASLDEICVAIDSVHNGRRFISHSHIDSAVPPPHRAPRLGNATSMHQNHRDVERSAGDELSAREFEVLTLLADGLTNKQVAAQLFLSVKTVETYRSRIMKKYDLAGRSELVNLARQLNSSVPENKLASAS